MSKIKTKKCTGCGEIKLFAEFSKEKRTKLGLKAECKACDNARNAAYRKANPEKEHARRAAYRKANPEKERATRKMRRYGLTPEMERQLIDEHDGCCWLCDVKFTNEGASKPHIDHDHDLEARSGEKFVRGILCRSCNLNLGRCGDNLEDVMRYVTYLRNADARYRRSKLVVVKTQDASDSDAPPLFDLTTCAEKGYATKTRS